METVIEKHKTEGKSMEVTLPKVNGIIAFRKHGDDNWEMLYPYNIHHLTPTPLHRDEEHVKDTLRSLKKYGGLKGEKFEIKTFEIEL